MAPPRKCTCEQCDICARYWKKRASDERRREKINAYQRSPRARAYRAERRRRGLDRGRKSPGAAKRWHHRNKEKYAAHREVRNAIEHGELVREPCEACGGEPVEAHHDDYSKPLEVRWLCRPCHAEHHRLEREAARAAA